MASSWSFTNTSTGRDGSKQSWTVPADGNYTITAYGAQGGGANSKGHGGLGAKVSGIFTLQAGQVLEILVGQQGESKTDSNDPHALATGGGGTFVVFEGGTTQDDILLVAGGGGGHASIEDAPILSEAHGNAGTAGSDGVGEEWSEGGTDGDGGGYYTGGPGGGFFNSTDDYYNGESYLEGGTGGYYDVPDLAGGYGGAGGCGAGASNTERGSGAGGYSGGGGAKAYKSGPWNVCGGGGGSYNGGAGGQEEGGVRSGHGLVEIEEGPSGEYVDIGKLLQTSLLSTTYSPRPFENTSTGVDGSKQYWTVPSTARYRITAYGAKGGGNEGDCGLGAKMSGLFTLEAGTELEVLVGQAGLLYDDTDMGGGGGASFVCKKGASKESEILVIAGGGGGFGYSGYSNNKGIDAVTGTAGTDGQEATNNGGTSGEGGDAVSCDFCGAGGGGFFTAGGDNVSGYADGGAAYVNGAAGGVSDAGNGGYGCGGGNGYYGGGGGGGYSGGGGSGADGKGGGGGGSYNNGSEQQNDAGVRFDHGRVVIELVDTPTLMEIGRFMDSQDLLFSSPRKQAWFFEIKPASSKLVHLCTLTGDADSLSDLILSISHFSYRMSESGNTSLQVKVPNMARYITEVSARINGELVIDKGIIYGDGSRRLQEFVRAGNFRIGYSLGDLESALILRSSDNISFNPNYPTDQTDFAEISRSRKKDGTYQFKVEPTPGLYPGNHVWISGKRYRIIENSATIGPTVSRMELQATWDPEA